MSQITTYNPPAQLGEQNTFSDELAVSVFQEQTTFAGFDLSAPGQYLVFPKEVLGMNRVYKLDFLNKSFMYLGFHERKSPDIMIPDPAQMAQLEHQVDDEQFKAITKFYEALAQASVRDTGLLEGLMEIHRGTYDEDNYEYDPDLIINHFGNNLNVEINGVRMQKDDRQTVRNLAVIKFGVEPYSIVCAYIDTQQRGVKK